MSKEKTVKELRQEKRDKLEKEQAKKSVAVEGRADVAVKRFTPLSISIIAIALAAVIGLSVFAGILIARAVNPYSDVDNPVAEITMSDGKKLVFQLFYDEAPIAVTVFHYYAYNKYYNGTVIDAKTPKDYPDSLKLGRYTDSVVGYSDPKPRMLVGDSEYNNGNFNFFMKNDSNVSRPTNEIGALSTIKLDGGASAEFQIAAPEERYGNGADVGWVFGWAYNDSTINAIRHYAKNLETATDSTNIVPGHIVKIKSIKFYNDKELKKHVNKDSNFNSSYVSAIRSS